MNAGLDAEGISASITALLLNRWQHSPVPLVLEPTRTLKELGISSLDVIELILDVEEHFDITFPDSGASSIAGATLQDLLDATRRQLREKNQPQELL